MLAPVWEDSCLIVADVPDPRVLQAARRGDEHALRAVVEVHSRGLHAVPTSIEALALRGERVCEMIASRTLLPYFGLPAESA